MALPWVIAPLVDALDRARRARGGAALGGADRARDRLAGGVRLHVPARQPRAAAARAGPRAGGAALARECAPAPARVGHPQPRVHAPGARRSPPRSPPPAAPRRRSTPATSSSTARAAFGVAREHGHGAARARPHHRRAGDAARGGRRPRRLTGPARARPRARRARAAASRSAPGARHSPSAAARPRSPPRPATRSSPTGAKPRRAALTGAAALTAAQQRVARLAAGGLDQPRDRRDAVPDREDRRGPPRRAPTASSASARAPSCPTRSNHVAREQVVPGLAPHDRARVALAREDHRDPAGAVVVVGHRVAVGAGRRDGEQVADARGVQRARRRPARRRSRSGARRPSRCSPPAEAVRDRRLEALVEQRDLEVVAHAAVDGDERHRPLDASRRGRACTPPRRPCCGRAR